ncbi:MAG: lysine--tRNA ligase [Chthonomonas sp.]|nr:lysine--tRNA ligase [Chthonomonas sp.]
MSEDQSLRDIRLQNLQMLRELGFDPFAQERFVSSDTASGLLERFEEGKQVQFAGRVVASRLMGKAAFAHLSDGDGKIQVYFRKDDIGETLWEVFKLLDLGDHVGVSGELFVTKTGEQSIHVRDFVPLSKCLQSLPLGKEKDGQQWYGLTDVDQRYRHRHLDLIANPESRKLLLDRSRIVSSVRRFMDSRGYLEVETPLLQLEAGGAAARPFLTHYNFYELEVKLRISLELYLKRCICGDVPKVYEIGRVFRNESVSNRHNPEFTLLEFYEAYSNLEDIMTLVEEMMRSVALEVFGTTKILHGETEIDFGPDWHRVDLLGEIGRHTQTSPEDFATLETAKKALAGKRLFNEQTKKRIILEEEHQLGGLIEKLLEVFVEPTLIQPSFVIGYPLETSPLAKKDPARPGFTRRFEGYVLGRELCNAFSEINDPIDQRERFEGQVAEREKGDEEAHPMDEDFIYALECGMPPTGGCGIGIDRMAMLLTGADSLREILLFPMMRPESHAAE